MRYQQPIYIQNESSGVRNKDILNVNMSSDMCVFEAPVFTISGASKIPCDCGCPVGWVLLEDGTCQFLDSISATSYGTFFTAYTGTVNSGYDVNGSYFYKNNLTGLLPYSLSGASGSGVIIDNTSGYTINPDTSVTTGTLWDSLGSSANGRLNNCGIWGTLGGTGAPEDQWVGFSKCVNLETTGIYSIGIAGDNRVRFKINSELFYNGNNAISDSFSIWRVFEVTLSAGTNIIELEGYNDGSYASFGAEIYSVGISGLTGLTTEFQLSELTVFTTKDFRYDVTGIPVIFDLGESSGYSCPSGYFLNTCVTPYSCSTIVNSACTIPSGSNYIIDATTATTIPLTFDFTSNLDSLSADTTSFKFEVYKFNNNANIFVQPPVYKSETIYYSAISGTSSVTQTVPINKLLLDGQYLVKGFYNFNVCTEYLNKLGKKVDTSSFINGSQYALYNENLDFYFTAISKADVPTFTSNGSNSPVANQLFQQIILPKDGETNITITNTYSGFFILTLNGLVLAKDIDFTYTGSVVTLFSPTILGDIITVSYTTNGGNTLAGDNLYINSTIPSGTSNNQGSNLYYFNTTTGKYEIYTTTTPSDGGKIIVMINGVTLANGIDYYQSTTNKKRIILEGNLILNDVITMVYFPITPVINGIYSNKPIVSWSIKTAPQLNNGFFSLEVSTGNTFNNFYYSGSTNYVINELLYSDTFIASGTIGTTLYYRVKNEKNFETICGKILTSISYSETLPIIIQTNSINSY